MPTCDIPIIGQYKIWAKTTMNNAYISQKNINKNPKDKNNEYKEKNFVYDNKLFFFFQYGVKNYIIQIYVYIFYNK